MSPTPRPSPLANAVLRRDRRTLARVITRIENRDPSVIPLLRELYPRTGRAHVIGMTGPLGVGKSSLINALLKAWRAAHRTVGIVAVDPSSPYSGGSVLGDRVRIERTSGDEGIFFRSMASRGHAGGIAAATREVARLLDAAGFDLILVETVGSGQVDVEVREVATTSVVVLVPHLGDDVQTLKAGLFEIADLFCVNKRDLPGADLAAKDLTELVGLSGGRDGWRPPVLTTSTLDGGGVAELAQAIDAHEQFLETSGTRVARERVRVLDEVIGLLRERLERDLTDELERDPRLRALLEQVANRGIDPHTAADRWNAAVSPPRRGRRPPP
jgi:LAO/AO transport system kinase